jgi:signal transduction histidine kinase
MKIRDRLTITFSLTALLAVAGLGFSVYWFTANFHTKEFFQRLEERVQITELIFLEKNVEISQAVREKFLHTLDEEKEFAITLQPTGLDSMNQLFYPGFSDDIMKKETVRFWQGKRQGVGRHYVLPRGEYAVIVTAVDVFGHTKLRFLLQILMVGMFCCVLLLVVVSRVSTSRALRPLESKIHKAANISANRLNLRLEVNNPSDELGELAIAFNRMLDRLQTAFESQKHFVNNASHEMRNPLTAIIGETEVLLGKKRTEQEYREALQVIGNEAERLEILTRQLLELAKAESLSELPEPEELPLEFCLSEVLDKFPPQRLVLKLPDIGTSHFIFGNSHLLHTALSNIVENALKYSGDKLVTIETTVGEDNFLIKITDQGIGIPPGELDYIFHPLHRARNARHIKGHGVGLALSKKIIDLHHGSLLVQSEEGKGTVVTVKLPRLAL